MAEEPNIQADQILISIRTISEMTDASRVSVRRWLRQAGINPVAVSRGRRGGIRYRWQDIKDWLEQLTPVD